MRKALTVPLPHSTREMHPTAKLARFICEAPQRGAKTQRRQTMRKNLAIAFTSLVVLFGASTFLSACNTVQGVGQDVSHAGREISEEAKEHK